ncbi:MULTISPECIES: ribonuclease domain-containing protein [unclassified Pseudonocardia]|uniref:ribonuclease domain-containing protein n=1 Tax=unclassified Pseudonocardia TaxID=2619320 RepID=UPI0001FFF04E|nr:MULTISPECIES: ribonuclease domain-containing protein [unclassified Pseudonocardia]OLM19699.1 Guanine-specific ribonuclease N1 and T1 precursor [Pseudonocardia sp. Ae707_Ps1]
MIVTPSARGPRALVVVLLAALLGALGLALPAAASAAPAVPAGVSAVAPAAVPGEESGLPVRGLSSLPAEARDTYDLIRQGGPFPYSQDGTTFQNREGILPPESSGHYSEYTVETPGLSHRGARRIVTGSDGEYYYTSDHYASFVVVDVSA